MKVVISSFGSSGDFNPCLGLGRALIRKGVDVIFLSNPFYEKKIIDAGLRFYPAGECWDIFKMIEDDPGFLHARKGPRKVWNLVLETIPQMYSTMSDLVGQEQPDLAACHILEFGGMLAAIQNHIPYATLSPTPMGWFGVKQPGYFNCTEMPLWIRCVQARFLRFLMNIAYRYQMNPFCKKRQIPNPIRRVEDIYNNALINLGFWSTVLRSAAPDDPLNSIICGFVRDEHIKDWPYIPDAIKALFNLDRKPVVVGMGSTASLHGNDIYNHVATACRQLNRPCLIIGKGASKYSDSDAGILTVDFAPYGWVFPKAAAIIHHGGVNTTAEALRSGVPSVVIPHTYDQFDNAIRAKRMGVSKRVRANRTSIESVTEAIKSVLNNTKMHKRSKIVSKQLQTELDGACIAAKALIQRNTN